ncbi:anthranilate synthase component I [Halalkalicoccus subterraneus]|uniref:anthranilate synthase component I n=1 Tax=Halalkalicoccus subterraneus TaxID=2675002 RepID=UPI000EFABC00|nr:anthranilate synthase component I [Halalkalicoccus subterraneus]
MIDRATFRERATVEEPSVVYMGYDLDVGTTPLAAYGALTDDGHGFLLESAEKVASSDPDGAFQPTSATATRHARYSFVGYDPEAVVTVRPDSTEVDVLGDERLEELVEPNGGDTLDTLRAALPDVPRIAFPEDGHLHGGLVGFLAYDAVYDLWLSEVGIERPASETPDAQFVLSTKTLVFDEVEGTLTLSLTPIVFPEDDPDELYDALESEIERVRSALEGADEPETGGFVRESELAGAREEYEAVVRETKEHVLDGDIYQGVLSRKRELVGEVDPLGLYEALREINPSPYMYLLGYGDRTVVGASPETLVSVRDGLVTSNPIAGTCSRGSSPVEDRRLAGEMLADDKERAEHTMLVDLARNDVRRVSEPGSVKVDEFMNVLKYSHVQHIESTVTGELAAECDGFDATRAAFPAGTLSGAPKIRAMEIIDELEREPRGIYGGGVGYYSWTGDADTAIAIRTATIEHGERDEITVQAGAGLVADSDPAAEYEETEKKMGGVLDAIERIEVEPGTGVVQ